MIINIPGAGVAHPDSGPDLAYTRNVLWICNFVTQGLTIVIVTLFILLRLYAKRRLFGDKFTWEDYTTYSAYILLMGYCIASCFAGLHPSDRDYQNFQKEDVENFYKAGYAVNIFYAPMTLCVKLSLLLLIGRVFGSSLHRKTVWGIQFLIVAIMVYYVSGLFIKIFTCWPISAYWRVERDKCLDQVAIITADASVSVITDVAILLLPTPLTWSLQLALKKRLRVIAMLCAGGFATAFSLYRLILIVTEARSGDKINVFIEVSLSGNAEVGIGLICSCLPAVNALCINYAKGSSYFAQDEYQTQSPSRSALKRVGTGDIMMTRTIRIETSTRPRSDCGSVTTAGHDDAALVFDAQHAPRADSPTYKSNSYV